MTEIQVHCARCGRLCNPTPNAEGTFLCFYCPQKHGIQKMIEIAQPVAAETVPAEASAMVPGELYSADRVHILSQHALIGVEPGEVGDEKIVVSVCRCGWKSDELADADTAILAWSTHVKTAMEEVKP